MSCSAHEIGQGEVESMVAGNKQWRTGDPDAAAKYRTTKLAVWRVSKTEERLEEVHPINVFYDKENYVVLWKYVEDSSSSSSSSDNTLVFYWSGAKATKGHSPLPEGLPEETPVERIVQWSEPAVFLRIFQGRLIVNAGENSSKLNEDLPHLYILRGETSSEAHLYEVDCKRSSLRSRTSFVLVTKPSSYSVWHGSRSPHACRHLAKRIAGSLFGLRSMFGGEILEGREGEEFLESVPGSDGDYLRSSGGGKELRETPRLFYFNSITGRFGVTEVEYPVVGENQVAPLPFLQSHLYTAFQPAIFLLDDGEELWLWRGLDDSSDGMSIENFEQEWSTAKDVSRRYAALKRRKSEIGETSNRPPEIHEVVAGREPLAFTNLFPTWAAAEQK